MTIATIEKNSIYNVDSNRPATAKQLYAAGRHFGTLQGKDAKEAYGLSKVFGAIMLKFNAEHCDTPITHGDVSKFFELEAVPPKFVKQITARAKPSKKVTKVAKVTKTAAPSKKVVKAVMPDTKPKASEQSVSEFEQRLAKLSTRVDKVEETGNANAKRLATMEAKLDVMMAWLETNPDA